MHRPLPPAGTDEESRRDKGQRSATVTALGFACLTSALWHSAAVHREGLGGGEDGGDPEEEAGPAGEGLRLLGRRQENLPDQ